jgi:hypothetical protein
MRKQTPSTGTAAMTHLVDTLERLGLAPEESLDGRWIKFRGARCAVYIVEAAWGLGYYTWCDAPHERTVEFYRDAHTAIEAGLRRAADQQRPDGNTGRGTSTA